VVIQGGLLHLVWRGGDWAGPQPVQSPPRCTKCTDPPIKATVLITVLLYSGPLLCCLSVPSKGLSRMFGVVVLSQMGYRLSPHFIQCLLYRYDPQRKQSLTFDAFVQSCVLLKSLTDIFRQKDTQMRGSIQISYEEFMCAVFASTF